MVVRKHWPTIFVEWCIWENRSWNGRWRRKRVWDKLGTVPGRLSRNKREDEEARWLLQRCKYLLLADLLRPWVQTLVFANEFRQKDLLGCYCAVLFVLHDPPVIGSGQSIPRPSNVSFNHREWSISLQAWRSKIQFVLYVGILYCIMWWIGTPFGFSYKVVDEDQAEFPAITVCNFNMFSRNKLKRQADKRKIPSMLADVVELHEQFEKHLKKGSYVDELYKWISFLHPNKRTLYDVGPFFHERMAKPTRGWRWLENVTRDLPFGSQRAVPPGHDDRCVMCPAYMPFVYSYGIIFVKWNNSSKANFAWVIPFVPPKSQDLND